MVKAMLVAVTLKYQWLKTMGIYFLLMTISKWVFAVDGWLFSKQGNKAPSILWLCLPRHMAFKVTVLARIKLWKARHVSTRCEFLCRTRTGATSGHPQLIGWK